MTTERIDVIVSERGSRRVARDIDEVGNAGNRAGQGVGFFTSQLAKFVSVAAVSSALTKATRDAILFQSSIAEVSTLVDEATFDMDRLTKATLDQATAFGSMPTEQAAAAYQIISAGATSAADATETLEAANRLAVGGITDVATAADGLTSVLNAYGDRVDGAVAVSDALFVAMRAGKTTIAELSGSLGQIAPLAAQTGVGFDELLASISALTKGGIATTRAVTGMRAVLAAVAKPSSEAAKLAEELGLEFNTAALESQGLAGFLEELVDATGGSTDQLAQLFGGVEALVPIMALAGGAGEDFAAILQDMADKGGATEDAFNKIVNSPGFQMDRVLASMKAESIQLGMAIATQLVPVLKFLADNMDTIFSVGSKLATFLTAYLAVSMARTVAGAATTMALRLIYVGSAMGATTTATALLTGATGYLNVAFRALTLAMATNPFGLAAIAIAGILTYMTGFTSSTQEAQMAVDNLTLALADELRQAGQLYPTMVEGTRLSLETARAKLEEAAARRENINNIIAERAEAAKGTEAYEDLSRYIQDINIRLDAMAQRSRAGAGGVGDLFPVERAFELQGLLIEAQKEMATLTGLTAAETAEVERLDVEIDRLDDAIANASDGWVVMGANVLDALGITERLTPAANNAGVAIGSAALQAAQLARNLAAAAQALSAVAGAASALDVGSIGLEAQNRALAQGNDLLDARAQAQIAQRRAELQPAFGSDDAILRIAAQQELDAYTAAVERNTSAQRTNLDLVSALNDTTSGGPTGGTSAASATQQLTAAQEASNAASATQQLTAAQEASNAALERKTSILEELQAPMQRYEQDMRSLTDLAEEGAISQGQFADSVRDVKIAFLNEQTDFASGFERGILKMQKDLDDVASSVEDALTGAFKGAEDALVSFVTTGKGDFKDLANSIIEDIIRIAIQQNVIKPLTSIIGGLGDSLFGGDDGGILGGLFGGIGAATGGDAVVPGGGANALGYATGGDFTVAGGGGVDSQLVQFRASPGETVSVKRPGQSGGSGGGNVTFNLNGVTDAESFKRSESQIAARMQRLLARGNRNG